MSFGSCFLSFIDLVCRVAAFKAFDPCEYGVQLGKGATSPRSLTVGASRENQPPWLRKTVQANDRSWDSLFRRNQTPRERSRAA